MATPTHDTGEQLELPGFRVQLHNFSGPFDLLLQLISARKLDITTIALAEVTDEFIAYTRQLARSDQTLEETTEFLVVAATLIDLKAARLVPRGEVDDEEDLELLESRDLLFARLLQYKAYKQAAEVFRSWQLGARQRYPRVVSPEERFATLLPKVVLGHTPDSFAELAAAVMRPRPAPEVDTSHLHQQRVSVPEQAKRLLDALTLAGRGTWVGFPTLIGDCAHSLEIVGRFLALLELYKAKAVEAEQPEPLGELSVSWTGAVVDPAVVVSGNWD